MKKIGLIFASSFLILGLMACQKIEYHDMMELSEKSGSAKGEVDLLNSDKIYPGISVQGVSLSNLSKDQALESLKASLDPELDKNKLTLKISDQAIEVSKKTIGQTYNYDKAINEAFAIARTGEDSVRKEEIKNLTTTPVDIKIEKILDEEKLAEFITSIANQYNKASTKAKFHYDANTGGVIGENGSQGVKVDNEKLAQLLKEGIDKNEQIQVPLIEEAGQDAGQLAARVNGKISSADSYFNAGYVARANNVEVSTRALNGAVIGPGETFSFNDYIGDTTPEKGYTMAIIIENDEEVPGYGGGACQTSTALYQAALKADMQIINRSPHTMIMPYSKGGLDAAIQYGSADLAFKNPFDFPVLIRTYQEPGMIQIDFYGDTNVKNYDISLYSEKLYDIPGKKISGQAYEAYKKNEATGEVTDLGKTIYPAID